MVPMVTVSSVVGNLSARGVSIGETDSTMSAEETVNSREQQQGATQEADPGSQEKVDLRSVDRCLQKHMCACLRPWFSTSCACPPFARSHTRRMRVSRRTMRRTKAVQLWATARARLPKKT